MSKVKVPTKIKVDVPAKAEPAPERTLAQVQGEFANLCARSGHLQYQVYTFNKELDMINGQIRDLNFEAAKLQAKAQVEAASAAEKAEKESK